MVEIVCTAPCTSPSKLEGVLRSSGGVCLGKGRKGGKEKLAKLLKVFKALKVLKAPVGPVAPAVIVAPVGPTTKKKMLNG